MINAVTNFIEYALENVPIETVITLAIGAIARVFFRSVNSQWLIPIAFAFWGSQLVINSNYWHNQPVLINMQKNIYYWKKTKKTSQLIICISCLALVILYALSKKLSVILACFMAVSWIIYKSSRPGYLLPMRKATDYSSY